MHKKDYLEEFEEAQDRQYTQWQYAKENRPSPFIKAKGNPQLQGISYAVGTIFMGVGAFLVFRWGNSWIGSIIVITPALNSRQSVFYRYGYVGSFSQCGLVLFPTVDFQSNIMAAILFAGISIGYFRKAQKQKTASMVRAKIAKNSRRKRKKKR